MKTRRKKKEEEEEEEEKEKRRKEDADVAEEFFLTPRAEFTARDSVQSPWVTNEETGRDLPEMSLRLLTEIEAARPQGLQSMKQPRVSVTEVSAILI